MVADCPLKKFLLRRFLSQSMYATVLLPPFPTRTPTSQPFLAPGVELGDLLSDVPVIVRSTCPVPLWIQSPSMACELWAGEARDIGAHTGVTRCALIMPRPPPGKILQQVSAHLSFNIRLDGTSAVSGPQGSATHRCSNWGCPLSLLRRLLHTQRSARPQSRDA